MTRHQSKKVTEFCRGKQCRLLLSDQCGSTETTVPCHIQLRGHGGVGTKPSDLFTIPECNACHDVLDGRVKTDLTREFVELVARRELQRHQQDLLDAGLVALQ